jgi:hypothetical protein
VNDQTIEIIDFKTNRFTGAKISPTVAQPDPEPVRKGSRRGVAENQIAFNFGGAVAVEEVNESLSAQIERVATDYQLQMQAYALAIRQLLPQIAASATIRATLHFLQPNVEFGIPATTLEADACTNALDNAMRQVIESSGPQEFPVVPDSHCRMCNFLQTCRAGRDWLRNNR